MEKPFKINFSNGISAQAIRINNETQISDALKQLGLPLGQPTIVLIGGAGRLGDEDLKNLFPIFWKVLAPIAETFKVNILDGGTNAGVMRLMGQARMKISANFPLIGIAARGTVILPDVESLDREAAPLESHHTHFVLVPGGNWGDESPWLSQIATKLAKSAPSITVLINGGEIARKDVEHSLCDKRPVVVVAGSGRLADELAADGKDIPLIKIINLTGGLENIIELFKNLLKEK